MQRHDATEYAYKNGYAKGFKDGCNIKKDEKTIEKITIDDFYTKNCAYCSSLYCMRDEEAIASCDKYEGNINGIVKKDPFEVIKKIHSWECYIKYLQNWAENNSDFKNFGSSPIPFSEFIEINYELMLG